MHDFRKFVKGPIGIIFLAIIATLFVGAPVLSGFSSGTDLAATVGDREITTAELTNEITRSKEQQRQRFGGKIDEAILDQWVTSESVLNQLINTEVLLTAADDNNLVIAPKTINGIIRKEFKENGKYSEDAYNVYLAQNRIRHGQFSEIQSRQLVIRQMVEAIISSSFATELDEKRIDILENQQRSIRYGVVTLKYFKDSVTVSDEDVVAHYKANSHLYMTVEQVSAEYLVLNKSDFENGADLSESAVRDAYEFQIETIKSNAKASHLAAHIFIAIDAERSAEAALKRAHEIKARIDGGEDFAGLAKELSDDLGSAAEGGDLGEIEEGVFPAEFDDVVFAMEQGEVSQPVKTDTGYHIIKLAGVADIELPTFEESKSRIITEIKSRYAEDMYLEKTEELISLAFESGDLSEPAKAMSLTIEESKLLSVNASQNQGLFANQEVMEALMNVDVLEEGVNSELVDLGNKSVVLRIKEHLKPKVKPLALVQSKIKASLLNEKASAALLALSEEIKGKLNSGTSVADLATEYAFDLETADNATRKGGSVDRSILQAAFKLPKPTDETPSSGIYPVKRGDFAIIELLSVKEGEAKDNSGNIDALAIELGQSEFGYYLEAQKQGLDISIMDN